MPIVREAFIQPLSCHSPGYVIQERPNARRNSRRHVFLQISRLLSNLNALSCSRTRRKEPRLATLLWSRKIHEVAPSLFFNTHIHNASDLEDEIEKLEASAELSTSDKSRLTSLKNDLSKTMRKKEEYVKEHPEQRRLIYRPRRQEKGEEAVEQKISTHPLEDSDEDIVMPEGPPPDAGLEDSESSDDDIPMPEGPPPNSVSSSSRTVQPLQNGTEARADQNNQAPLITVPPPFPPLFMPSNSPSFILPPPPPPPLGFNSSVYTGPPGGIPPPLPPPGFFPRRLQSVSTIQDPLSSIPHQTYQAHRASQLPPGHPSLPPRPPTDVPAGAVYRGAIISAEPELRDLKKEATGFVPSSLRRKKPSGVSSSSKVNAAPSVNVGSEATSPQARPDLVGVLKSQLGTVAAPASNSQVSDKAPRAPIAKGRDDYQKFVDEMSDLLSPPGSS